jgi:hypothetical protein
MKYSSNFSLEILFQIQNFFKISLEKSKDR